MTIRNAETMPVSLSEWQARGYHGSGCHEWIGSLKGRSVIIAGNAAGVFEQVECARTALTDPVIFGVNDAGMYLPFMDHWISLHAENLFTWGLMRAMTIKTNSPFIVHSVDARLGVTAVWDRLTPCFSLSGYFAMQLAFIMGADTIVLCGCPGNASPRFFEASPRTDFSYGDGDDGIRQQLIKEMSRVHGFKDAVRSISGGFTQDYFGGI